MLQYKDRVKETSTSTGTGVFALAGAPTGFRTFASVCSVADTFYYAIEAVDASGVPTGSWEVGFGSYSALNQLTRTTVLASSTGSAVNFAAGTKHVWIDLAATQFSNLVARNRRNLLINGNFVVNQRVYGTAGVLASGSYGHDRWKAGTGGGDYSFVQLPNSTTITIAANKTLIQVVEDKMVEGGSYVLSWTGTAQARYAVNSAIPVGAYASSPILISGQTAGTTMSVEFNAGTLTDAQLEAGSVPSSFERRSYGETLRRCQRYYEKSFPAATAPAQNAGTTGGEYHLAAAISGSINIPFKVAKRTGAPTFTTYNPSAANANWRDITAGADRAANVVLTGERGFAINSTAFVAGNANVIHWTAADEL